MFSNSIERLGHKKTPKKPKATTSKQRNKEKPRKK